MDQKRICVILAVLLILFSFLACGIEGVPVSLTETVPPPLSTPEGEENAEESVSWEETFVTEEVPNKTTDSDGTTTTTTVKVTTTKHTHVWNLSSETQSTCSTEGKKVWKCLCGKEKSEGKPTLEHSYAPATCEKGRVCTACGFVGSQPLGHQATAAEHSRCYRCGIEINFEFFALGHGFSIDEPRELIESKFGKPTEAISEGGYISLVYAAQPEKLTVIQIDAKGVWGFFTMDPAAWIYLDGTALNISGLSGTKDPNSDAFYRDITSYRVFGFRDRLGSGANYAMWLRCREVEYNYMEEEALFSDYYGQSRISLYYVNALRALNGQKILSWSKEAAAVASEYSAYMIENNFFNHDNSYGSRLKEKGIRYSWAGENISQGYINAYFVNDAYYNSAGHRENLLSSHFTHVGMGYRRKVGSQNVVFGAQIFYS